MEEDGRPRARQPAAPEHSPPSAGSVRLLSLAALALYAMLAFVYWGLPLVGHFGTRYIGTGTDPLNVFMWSLAWWPHAIAGGLNPLRLTGVWGSTPINMGWTTSIPLPALVLAPVTLAFGPVVSYNVLTLAAPALTAYTTFMLARELTRGAYLPSLAAGYLTGFSSFEIGQTQAHPFLTLAFLIPLMALLGVRVWRRYPERVGTAPKVALGALLLAQFLISTEIFTTVTLFGGLFVLIALVVVRDRKKMRPLLTTIEVGYGLALVVLAPILYTLVGHAPFAINATTRAALSTDLLNFVVPSTLNWTGAAFASVSRLFSTGNVAEQAGYLGIFLIALMTVSAVRLWNDRWARVTAYTLACLVIATLGPVLHVDGRPLIPLPWSILDLYPILSFALPGRFMLYVALLGSLLIAVYLARTPGRATVAWGLLAVSIVALIPAPSLAAATIRVPSFFTPAQIGRHLHPGETIFYFPFSRVGDGSFLQAESHFYFRLADGYLPPEAPAPWGELSLVEPLAYGLTPTDALAAGQLDTMLRLGGVRWVVGPERPSAGLRLLAVRSRLRYQGTAGGVSLWRRPGPNRGPAASPSALVLHAERQLYLTETAMLIRAARTYVARGLSLDSLSARILARDRLLPQDFGWTPLWLSQPGWTIWNGWVGAFGPHDVAIGLQGPWSELGPVAARYGHTASRVYFPYPAPSGPGPKAGSAAGILLLVFSLQGLGSPK